MAAIEQKLTDMLAPIVEAEGFELVGIEFIRAGKHSTLRIYIDHEDGITVDNCATVSYQASSILDVEDPISTEYTLEVSSPGVDRPLFNAAQYQKAIGEEVKMQLNMPVEGQRNMRGELTAVDGEMITIQLADKSATVALDNIRKANIIGKI
ncbi:ribosome maturation factor RimP [Paraferrimonas sedimenticola]|uniref:Ribosome maturation factor RimP n=1 Tax=Paraferrimonas sedimenticola TaxID=375674 RepID=A0AA37RY35_9GAMM|nr:ribosome maturation factor RimP [Paraferrimonas sedimenticola]GLP97019.1 ribosome maturation factor RimP [Paraferrimonas sedimenticola]